MCQGFVTARVARLQRRFMNPRLWSWRSNAASSSSPWRIRRKTRTTLVRTIRLRTPTTSRKEPETVGPISPVALCSQEPSSLTSPPRPANADREQRGPARRRWWSAPARRRNPTLQRALALVLAHELARRVVDRADVVGVERVAQPELCYAVTPTPSPSTPTEARSNAEADDVQAEHHDREQPRTAPLRRRHRAPDARPARARRARRSHKRPFRSFPLRSPSAPSADDTASTTDMAPSGEKLAASAERERVARHAGAGRSRS